MTPDEAIAALPFGRAFRFVERVIATDRRTSIVTGMRFDSSLEVIAAHAALGDLVPGSVLIEQAAQTALVLALLRGDAAPGRFGVVGAAKARFDRPVRAPAELFCALTLAYLQTPQLGFAAETSADGEVIARITGACTLEMPAAPA